MNLYYWLKPGLKIKRWLLMGGLGITVLVLGMSKLLFRGFMYDMYSLLYAYISLLGVFIIIASLRLGFKNILSLILENPGGTGIGKQRLGDILYEKRLLVRGPRIVAIGGGTGLSTMLRGLKEYTTNITAIVTVADDGGGSGVLRESLGMLPPGDIRNCLVAMAHTEPLMEELMQYRFQEGDLKGQSFGNLFIAAMTGISSNFEEAIKKMSDVLAVKGRVYPVTLEDIKLFARLSDGSIIKGESNIPNEAEKRGASIERIYLEPENPRPLEDALYEIDNADCIIMGPGSLYTSVLPNLVIKEVTERIRKSKAPKIYVSNIMTQPGETDGYSLSMHINAIEKHCGKGIIDYVIANDGVIPEPYFKKYQEDGQDMVALDLDAVSKGIEVIEENLVFINDKGLLRHNTAKLSNTVMKILLKHSFPRNKRRIMDFYYLSAKVKEKQREVK